jgi:phage/plasmid-associated DNA primase
VDDSDGGFSRRLLFLRCNNQLKVKPIPEYDKLVLAAEQEEIVSWAVRGMVRLVQQGQYTLPASHVQEERQLLEKIDPVRYFLKTCPRLRVGKEQTQKDTILIELYNEYHSYVVTGGSSCPCTHS